MRILPSKRGNAATTLFEVGVVVALVVIFGVAFLVYWDKTHRPVVAIQCVDNVMQVNLASRFWEGEHGGVFPMGLSETNGGAREAGLAGNVVKNFLVMSNELVTPKFLICPEDVNHAKAAGFGELKAKNISYLIGVDATNESNSRQVLSGDSDFESGGKKVRAGLQLFGTNDALAWSYARHNGTGNLGFVDGSVMQASSSELVQVLSETGLITNRFVLP